jgi:hypothetical protein
MHRKEEMATGKSLHLTGLPRARALVPHTLSPSGLQLSRRNSVWFCERPFWSGVAAGVGAPQVQRRVSVKAVHSASQDLLSPCDKQAGARVCVSVAVGGALVCASSCLLPVAASYVLQ